MCKYMHKGIRNLSEIQQVLSATSIINTLPLPYQYIMRFNFTEEFRWAAEKRKYFCNIVLIRCNRRWKYDGGLWRSTRSLFSKQVYSWNICLKYMFYK